MNSPRRFMLRMIAFLAVVVAVVSVLGDELVSAFMANPPLNGMILGVLALGIAFTFRQVLGLSPEVRWIEHFRADEATASAPSRRLRLLAPMARMLADRKGKVTLSALATRSLLDSIGSRLDESREISRYMIGLLIFLGLLGTFWGLLDTVGSVGTVIGGLSADPENIVGTFSTLKTSLEAPLAGMGTAFSSSLFGLAGSLVLGFLDLQAGQAQNQFYNDLEEWLSSVTRLSSGAGVADGDQSVPVYVQALLEQTADSLEELQRTLSRGEEERRASNAHATRLAEQLVTLTDQMRAEQDTMARLAESQLDMKPVLQRLAEGGGNAGGFDEATRSHIRNLDVYLARLLEETVNSRNYLASELRGEIKLLGRVIAAAAPMHAVSQPLEQAPAAGAEAVPASIGARSAATETNPAQVTTPLPQSTPPTAEPPRAPAAAPRRPAATPRQAAPRMAVRSAPPPPPSGAPHTASTEQPAVLPVRREPTLPETNDGQPPAPPGVWRDRRP